MQAVDGRRHQARAGGPQGVAQGNGTAPGIDAGIHEAQSHARIKNASHALAPEQPQAMADAIADFAKKVFSARP